ncbi:TetR/AcrR family transcriptional regulator [soil metagenome]
MKRETPPTRAERIRKASARRRTQRKEELRRAILDAAGRLFLEHGFERFSLRQVAEHIGYSATTIYLHFKDKDALLFAVALEGFSHFCEALQKAYESAEEPWQRLEAVGRAYIRFGLGHPVHYRLMFMQRGEFMTRPKPDDHRPPIDSFGVLLRAVEEALEAGVMKPGDPTGYANTLWAGVHGIVALTITMPFCDEVQAAQMADVFFPMTVRGLGHPRAGDAM